MIPGTLNVIGGTDRGKQFPLTAAESRVGRGADQDVVLSDIAVSRRHITIGLEGLNYKLTDLGSGNGTLVNGQRISVHYLKDGDVVEIGQTVMRFEHAASRAQPAPVAAAAPAPVYVPPSPARPMPPAPSAAVDVGGYASPAAGPQPVGRAEPYAAQGGGGAPAGPGRLIAFAVMGVLCVGSVIIILTKTVFAKPVVVQSDTEELFKAGLRLFASHSFDEAKTSFSEALAQAPDSPDVKRYVEACDNEIDAKQLYKTAESAISRKRYLDAFKALEKIDSSSILSEQVTRLRRDHGPKAAKEEAAEATRVSADDPNAARAKAQHALRLDPNNEEARGLLAKLGAGAVAVAPKEKDVPAEEAPEKVAPPEKVKPEKVAKAEPEAKEPKEPKEVKVASSKSKSKKGDDEGVGLLKIPGIEGAPVAKSSKPDKDVVGSPAPSGNAMVAYKNKDFDGAMKAFRAEALASVGPKSQKAIDTANQVKQLKIALDKAAGEESSQPTAAAKDYEEALGLDAKISKGIHASFIKQKMSKTQVAAGQQLFASGKYEQAYQAATGAQKAGADAGSLLKQLESKATELTQKGEGMKKTNLAQAKTLWRQVIKIVPSSSPIYIKAYTLINSAGANRKDEDED